MKAYYYLNYYDHLFEQAILYCNGCFRRWKIVLFSLIIEKPLRIDIRWCIISNQHIIMNNIYVDVYYLNRIIQDGGSFYVTYSKNNYTKKILIVEITNTGLFSGRYEKVVLFKLFGQETTVSFALNGNDGIQYIIMLNWNLLILLQHRKNIFTTFHLSIGKQ